MNQFPMTCHHLLPSNFKAALLSSGAIPVAMQGVADIPGVPGMFRDGGILDYHLDIPFLPNGGGFVLYPHFYDHITPGWFDKYLGREPDPGHMEDVVLVAPSSKFIAKIPFGKIPDRKDFKTFHLKDKERMAYWRKVVELNPVLGDEFAEAILSKKIREIVQPI